RLLALEDATSVAASQAIHLGQVRPIGDEAAGAGKFPVRIHCRHRVARGECDDPLPPASRSAPSLRALRAAKAASIALSVDALKTSIRKPKVRAAAFTSLMNGAEDE